MTDLIWLNLLQKYILYLTLATLNVNIKNKIKDTLFIMTLASPMTSNPVPITIGIGTE